MFPYVVNNHSIWLSYFSEGLKPPTSLVYRHDWLMSWYLTSFLFFFPHVSLFMAKLMGFLPRKMVHSSEQKHGKDRQIPLETWWKLFEHCGVSQWICRGRILKKRRTHNLQETCFVIHVLSAFSHIPLFLCTAFLQWKCGKSPSNWIGSKIHQLCFPH